jgi:hypothetical protein
MKHINNKEGKGREEESVSSSTDIVNSESGTYYQILYLLDGPLSENSVKLSTSESEVSCFSCKHVIPIFNKFLTSPSMMRFWVVINEA